jgi:hypothetical protein
MKNFKCQTLIIIGTPPQVKKVKIYLIKISSIVVLFIKLIVVKCIYDTYYIIIIKNVYIMS